MNVEVGQKVWFSAQHRYGPDRYMTVTKVGRKWATLDGYRPYRFDIETGWVDGGQYCSPGRCWESQEACEAAGQLVAAWDALRQQVERKYHKPEHVTLVEIQQVREILRLDPQPTEQR